MAAGGAKVSAKGCAAWSRRTPMVLAPKPRARAATAWPTAPNPTISHTEPRTSRKASGRHAPSAWAARRSGPRWKWSSTPATT